MKRKGISEIVGALIIITIITISVIMYTTIIRKNLNTTQQVLNQKINEIIDYINPPSIIPIPNNGQLDILIAPTTPNENITIIIKYNHNNTLKTLTIKSNKTYIYKTIIPNYNCEEIKIYIITESGSIIQYNAYNDPRVTKKLLDPYTFSCYILDNQTSQTITTEITKIIELNTLNPILKLNTSTKITLEIVGKAFIKDNDPICDINVTFNNKNYTINTCNQRIEIEQLNIGLNQIKIYFVTKNVNKTIYGYLLLKSADNELAYRLKLNYTLLIKKYMIREYDASLGSITNSILPLPITQITQGWYNHNWTVDTTIYGYTIVTANGQGTAEIATNGPLVTFISTINENIEFTIKYDITISNIYYSIDYLKTYQLSPSYYINVRTDYIVKPNPVDIITSVITDIEYDDWYNTFPKLIINNTWKYNIKPNSDYKIICPNTCYPIIIFENSPVKLPFMTNIKYEENKKIISTQSHIYNLTIIMRPGAIQPLVSLPFIIQLNINDSYENWLTFTDIPGQIVYTNIQNSKWYFNLVGFTMGNASIRADNLNADLVCLSTLTNEIYNIPFIFNYSILNNNQVVCGTFITTKSQTIYLYTVVDYENKRYESIIEKLIYSYYSIRILISS